MEIKEAEKLRGALEVEILNVIHQFEEKTGLVIESIDLDHTKNIGEKPKTRIVSIKVAL